LLLRPRAAGRAFVLSVPATSFSVASFASFGYTIWCVINSLRRSLWHPHIFGACGMKAMIPLCLALAFVGCSPNDENSESSLGRDSGDVASSRSHYAKTLADDPTALDVLTAVGAQTKLNNDGCIIEVNLRGTNANDATLAAISSLKHVRSLRLNDLDITDTGLEALKDAHWPLSNLDLRGCRVSNAGLLLLSDLSSLRALRLSGSNGRTTVDDSGLGAIGRLTNLKILALDKLEISRFGLERLQPLQNLEELYLAKTSMDDEAVKLLLKFPKLRILRLSNTLITDTGLSHLGLLTGLVELDLSENSLLSNDGVRLLSRLTKLQKLNLWSVPISDEGVQLLAPLVELTWLNLDNTKLSDAALPALSELHRLTFLHLGSTQISDAGLPALLGLTNLNDLIVTRTLVTLEGVRELQKSLSDTDIQLDFLGL